MTVSAVGIETMEWTKLSQGAGVSICKTEITGAPSSQGWLGMISQPGAGSDLLYLKNNQLIDEIYENKLFYISEDPFIYSYEYLLNLDFSYINFNMFSVFFFLNHNII